MKDYLRELLKQASNPLEARNLVREYLQARILEELQKTGAMASIAFHGGTALRFLFRLPRYSEDLDFAYELKHRPFDLETAARSLKRSLRSEGYEIRVHYNDKTSVHKAAVRFVGLPYDLGISPHKNQILAIHIEVDMDPPCGAELDTTLIRRHIPLHLHHHNPSSLLAGKCHAILQRTYTKGRDLFDLFWYLSDPEWPAPNLTLLNNALQQSRWSGPRLETRNWKSVLREKIRSLNWHDVISDVSSFLETEASVALLTQKNLLSLLEEPQKPHK